MDHNFWDEKYIYKKTGWDLGEVSPPLAAFIDTLTDKTGRILIPGCGNCYEATYLLEKGFTNITLIDISTTLVNSLLQKFLDNPEVTVVHGDFFEHKGMYDLILEQTFFCALPPKMRMLYVNKMHDLLDSNGVLAGLLFNREFDGGPPFGGSTEEYQQLFKDKFNIQIIENAYNSIAPRANSEVFIYLKKQ